MTHLGSRTDRRAGAAGVVSSVRHGASSHERERAAAGHAALARGCGAAWRVRGALVSTSRREPDGARCRWSPGGDLIP
eukprot:5172606-Prymnesium_polylepis.1